MITSTTTSGFAFDLDPAAVTDMLFFEALCDAINEQANEFDRVKATARAVEILVGTEQKKALYKHIANTNNGRVPYPVLFEELKEIMAAPGKDAGKN